MRKTGLFSADLRKVAQSDGLAAFSLSNALECPHPQRENRWKTPPVYAMKDGKILLAGNGVPKATLLKRALSTRE